MRNWIGFIPALAVLLASCSEAAPPNPIADTAWGVVEIAEGDSTYVPPAEADLPTLTFTSEVVQDGVRRRLTGTGGCNLLAGSYLVAESDTLRVAALARTRKACPEPITQFETRLTRVLVDVTRYEITGSEMVMDHEVGHIRLERVESPDPAN